MFANMVTAFPFAIGPVILISAVGLLVLTLNNRLTQSVSRARLLCAEKESDAHAKEVRQQQLAVISRRAQLLRLSIEWLVASAVLSCLLVIVLFLGVVFDMQQSLLPSALFLGSLGCMIAGLLTFIYEVRQALVALELEISLHTDK